MTSESQFIPVETVATCDPRLGEDVSKFGSVFKAWLKLISTSNLTSRVLTQLDSLFHPLEKTEMSFIIEGNPLSITLYFQPSKINPK